ncbi:MAG TPA: hypothetical protein VK171_05250, partial [Fimbriimonas sp.]|nr:hypothetical protein [Fimbriimonas sp.]
MSRVSSMLVTSDDINAFAAKEKAAEELLPQILRKLVLASAKTATEIAFPTGKAINEGGWDGQVTCKTAELFVPSGKSGWELTARRDQVTKAQGDYDERLKSVDSVDQKKTTFIHWNMRKWGEAAREKWIKERKNEEKWLDVCAYDAKSLETWLLNHLGIHLWVSERMGKKPVDAQDIFSFWSDWSHTSTPPLTPEILTVGYEIQRSAIFEAIEQNSPTISIQWERPDLVTAFVAAIMTSSSDPKIEQIASRCIYIKTQQAFDALASQHQGLILIPAFRP